ncbi:MAG: MerC domain-containing protein [Deltaproteobacteria bacterium]|nr:MerC domain-containing protein [Deltaproteobacteria bacterium]
MTPNRISKIHGRLDKIGACLSFACAIHCIAMPFIITVLPLLGLGILAHSSFETFMFIITISLATASLCWGTYIHRETRVLLFLAAAILLFYIGGFTTHSEHEAVLVGFGGVCLAVGHFINLRLCKSCRDCCEHEHVTELAEKSESEAKSL